MFLYGSFINKRGEKITVNILTNKDRSKSLEIGGSEKRVYFTGDPVEITGEINNTFDHLIRHSATIHLLAAEFMPDLFQTNARDSVVNIFRNDVCIFAGFLEPQVYSQQYNARYDELELLVSTLFPRCNTRSIRTYRARRTTRRLSRRHSSAHFTILYYQYSMAFAQAWILAEFLSRVFSSMVQRG